MNQRTRLVSSLARILILVLALPPAIASATDSAPPQVAACLEAKPDLATVPFSVGEELLFEVRWMGLLAGTASMAVNGQLSRDGRDVYHIRTLAQSSPFFSVFYNVRDFGETYVDVRGLYPWYFHLDQREGKRVVQRTVTFDQQRGIALYSKNHALPQEVAVPPRVQDSLSSLYLLRTLPLRVGDQIPIQTFSNGRTYDVEIQVLRRERVEAYWGPVDAFVVRPVLRFQEILRQTGDVLIWLTDDERRLPIRMRTEIKVGTIEATLIDVKGVQ